MKRKICAAFLSLLLSLSLLTGCGANEGITDNSGNETQQSQGVDQGQENQNNEPSGDSTDDADVHGEAADANGGSDAELSTGTGTLPQDAAGTFDYSTVPAWSGTAYVTVHNNVPYFDTGALKPVSSEAYADLDSLGRCGVAYSCVGQDIMPTEERGSIGMVKPTGWHTVKYDIVDGKYLYNRCHLIGYQLSAENANTSNLITGTRFLNIEGMLPFENMTADYVKETDNHVAYRVTPVFVDNELVARGVLMEGWSVEDDGDGICFCVFAYNAQPGVEIDYATGDSWLAAGTGVQTPVVSDGETTTDTTDQDSEQMGETYILNTNTKKFHRPDCSSVDSMKESNKQTFTGSRDDIINQGYEPCKRCNP